MTWSSIHPGPDTWNFAPVDTLVDFASNHQMKVKGHTLIWSVDYFGLSVGQIGQMREMTTDDFRQTVNEHISTLLGHYKGKIHAWNVLCEALDESGELRKSLFLEKMGQGYVADIFHMAHEADPDAILLYHDYGAEGLSPKSDGQYKLVKYLVNEHVPIDGVALQMHLAATNEPPNIITMSKSNPRLTLKDISENIRRLADLGLKVEIAEMDLQIRNLQGDLPERLKLQRRIYHDVIDTCLREKGFTDITFWGFTDAYSWIDQTFGPDDPLLFDENYQPKPAYWGVMDALLSA
jgi:GH35 family endo-1,4-beta-xylanase